MATKTSTNADGSSSGAAAPSATSGTAAPVTLTKPPHPADPTGLPPKPDDVTEAAFLESADLEPQTIIDYLTAKIAYTDAYQTFEDALVTAGTTFDAVFAKFSDAFTAYQTAQSDSAKAVTAAQAAATVVATKVTALQSIDPAKSADVTTALADIQTAVDDYKTKADDVATKAAAVTSSEAAVKALGDTTDFDIANPVANPHTASVSVAQYKIDTATATGPLKDAYDAYLVSIAKLRGQFPQSATRPAVLAAA